MGKVMSTEVFAGASWLQKQFDYMKIGIQLNQFQRDVANILGAVYQGIYHIEREVMKADWKYPDMVKITTRRELATWDGSELTILVVKAHEKSVRVAIEGVGPGYTRIIFHERDEWEGTCGMTQHPGLEEGIRRAKLYTAE